MIVDEWKNFFHSSPQNFEQINFRNKGLMHVWANAQWSLFPSSTSGYRGQFRQVYEIKVRYVRSKIRYMQLRQINMWTWLKQITLAVERTSWGQNSVGCFLPIISSKPDISWLAFFSNQAESFVITRNTVCPLSQRGNNFVRLLCFCEIYTDGK